MPSSYRTTSTTLKHARRLRRDMTMAERKLWSVLRSRQIDGCHFRHQVPVGDYITDFCCLSRRLIVEVDGSQHADSTRDLARSRWLENQSYRVLRFWNNEVLENLEGVRETIRIALMEQVTES